MKQPAQLHERPARVAPLSDEVLWHREMKGLRNLAITLLQEIQTLESIHCMDVKHQVLFYDEVERFEIKLIERALFVTGGSQVRAARLLGITLSNLNNKIKRYKISVNPNSAL